VLFRSDEVWNYVFLEGPVPPSTDISLAALETMRREFSFWYPLDLRVSGKDLIKNHLVMALYNHAAIWRGRTDRMPQGFFTNGHVLVDGEKMSKSAGNFITLLDGIKRWSADACRITLALAGDSLNDANFECHTADSMVQRLVVELEWYQGIVKAAADGELKAADSPKVYWDLVFENRVRELMATAHKKYKQLQFREAMQSVLFLMLTARDQYRETCARLGMTMHAGVALQYIECQVITLAPVCPHLCDYVWREVLGHSTSVFKAQWPALPPVDRDILDSNDYLFHAVHIFRTQLAKSKVKDVTKAVVYACSDFTPWQRNALEFLQTRFNAETTPHFTKSVLSDLKKAVDVDVEMKKYPKRVMVFAGDVVKTAEVEGIAALSSRMTVNEVAILTTHFEFVTKSLGLDITVADANSITEDMKIGKLPTPLNPVIVASA